MLWIVPSDPRMLRVPKTRTTSANHEHGVKYEDDGVPLARQGTVAGGREVRVLWWGVAAHALICVFDAGVGVAAWAGGVEGFGG